VFRIEENVGPSSGKLAAWFGTIAEMISPCGTPPEVDVDQQIVVARRFRYHWNMLLAAVAVIGCAFLLEVRSDQRVALALVPQWPLPETCPARYLFNVECPGCGLTRSFIYLARRDLRAAWRMHRLGGILATLVVLQIPYRLTALFSRDGNPLGASLLKIVGLLLVVLLFVNWLANLFARLTG